MRTEQLDTPRKRPDGGRERGFGDATGEQIVGGLAGEIEKSGGHGGHVGAYFFRHTPA
jgi:hypothetical protein